MEKHKRSDNMLEDFATMNAAKLAEVWKRELGKKNAYPSEYHKNIVEAGYWINYILPNAHEWVYITQYASGNSVFKHVPSGKRVIVDIDLGALK